MFPKMVNDKIRSIIDRYRNKAPAWKLTGAGAGGYLVIVTENDIENSIEIKIRRRMS